MADETQQNDKEQATAVEKEERFIEPQPMREDQVQNAVNFLSHPKVKGSPVVYRRSFLERKGLTKEEIDEAFRRVPDPPSTAAAQEPAKPAAMPAPVSSAVQSSLHQLQTVPVPRKGLRWSQIVLAIGLTSAAGAGAAVLTKNYLYPKLRAWLRRVVLDEEAQKSKTAADSEASKIAAATASAAAATAAAATAAAEMAKIAKELVAVRAEDRRYMDGVLKSLETRDREIKATLDALLELQQKTKLLSPTANGDSSAKKGYFNQGREDVKLSSGSVPARSAGTLTSTTAAASTNTPYSPSYMEVLAMVERGEKPPGIRDVQDKPPNANQTPSESLFPPKPKPWETRQQSNGSDSVPWWRQKADTTSVRITELDDKQSSNGRGWVPPPAPKPVMPGADAAIRYRPSQKSPPPTPDTQSSSPATRYHEMNGDSAHAVTDKSVDIPDRASSEPEVYKEATQEEQQQYDVEQQDERQQQEQQEAEIQRHREDEIQQQEDEIQKQQEGEVHVDLS